MTIIIPADQRPGDPFRVEFDGEPFELPPTMSDELLGHFTEGRLHLALPETFGDQWPRLAELDVDVSDLQDAFDAWLEHHRPEDRPRPPAKNRAERRRREREDRKARR